MEKAAWGAPQEGGADATASWGPGLHLHRVWDSGDFAASNLQRLLMAYDASARSDQM